MADRRELLRRLVADFEAYCETCLRVEDKQTLQLVPLRLKPIQRRLAQRILERWLRGAPVRIIVLKARREGVSTVVQAFFFWVAATRPSKRGFTVAHDDDTASYLHGMSERYYENLPPFIRPQRRQSRKGSVLEFANPSKKPDDQRLRPGLNSSLSTVSQKNAGAGKGAGMLHLSEVGLWQKESAKKTLDTILQAVPRAGQTAVVMESTARGMGNEFHHRWILAEQGKSEYEAIFFPWCEEPTYREPPPADFKRTEEEDEVARVALDRWGIELDDAQLEWRRLTLENECGGDLDTLHQEYPLTPEEAFLSTGRPYFNMKAVARHLEIARETRPWKQGQLKEEDHEGDRYAVFEESRRGPLTIWEAPEPEEDYLIFCDSSEGTTGDFQAAYVFARSRLAIVAAWHGRVDRDSLGDELYLLGKLYNEALIAVEVSGGWGMTPLAVLKRETRTRKPYRRIYMRTTVDRRSQKRQVSMGWKTTPESRALMLDALNQALRTDALEVNDPELLKECMTFVYNDAGKPEAEEGCYDDRVIAAAGGVYLFTNEPRRHAHQPPEKRKPVSSVAGY